MKELNKKVAVITGAGSGIGRALAWHLARQGCHLALSDVNVEGLRETAEQARKLGVTVSEQRVDVADRAAVEAWAEQIVVEFGRVNAIFNNAGVAQGGTVEGNDHADYEWIMNINFWGVVNGTKAFLPYLKNAGQGHVINVSSVFGLFSQPGMSAYNATTVERVALNETKTSLLWGTECATKSEVKEENETRWETHWLNANEIVGDQGTEYSAY